MEKILILLMASFFIGACSPNNDNINIQDENILSGSIENKEEIPSTEITETWTIFFDTWSSTEDSDLMPPEASGVFVQ